VDFCVGDDRFVNPTPAYLREQYQLLDDLYRSVPVVACVDGRAEDIGAAVALSCPFRIATSTTAITPFGA
jgi:enoyl-CoA hydratase/carnithine racemase